MTDSPEPSRSPYIALSNSASFDGVGSDDSAAFFSTNERESCSNSASTPSFVHLCNNRRRRSITIPLFLVVFLAFVWSYLFYDLFYAAWPGFGGGPPVSAIRRERERWLREAEDGTRKGLGLSSAPKHPVTASNVALNGPGGAAGTGDHGTDGVGTEMGEQRFACATFLAEKRRKKKKQAAKGRTDNPTNLEQEDDSDDPYFTACRVLTYQLLHSPATRNHLLNPSPPEKTWAPSSLTLPSLPPLPHSSPPTLIKPNTTKHLSPKISSLVQLRGDRSMD